MKYKLQQGSILDTELGLSIPLDSDNRHYVEYLVWVSEGNTADPEYDTAELDVQRIADIKAEASSRIIAILPETKQRNLLARMIELQHKGTLTVDEIAEQDAALAIWATIKDIRTTSNDAEIAGTELADIIW